MCEAVTVGYARNSVLVASMSSRSLPVAAAVALTIAACGHQKSPSTAAPAPAPAFRALADATDIGGSKVGPASAATVATVVIVFASWCQPCRQELAILGGLRDQHPNARIVGINAYEDYAGRSDHQRLQAFLAESAPWLRVIRANKQLLRAFGGVPKVPSVFVYDRRGVLIHNYDRTRTRPPTAAELDKAIARASDSS